MKKSVKIFAVGALALGFASGCASNESTSLFASSLNSTKDVYAYSALSTTNLLATVASTQAPLSMNVSSSEQQTTLRNGFGGFIDRMLGRREVTLSDEEMAEVNSYVGVFESLLSDADPITTVIVDSEDENYTYKMTITTKTIDNTSLEYAMYYNEVVTETGEDVDLEDMDDAVTTNLEGIMIINDLIYDVIGSKVVSEERSLVTFTSKIDDQNFVRVNQVVVNNRSQFTYTVVSEGQVISQSKVRFASLDNKETIYLETLNEGVRNTYRFTKIVNADETYIHMMIGSGINTKNVIIRISIDETTGEEVYSYYAGSSRLGALRRAVKNKFARHQ